MKYRLLPKDHFSSLLILAICILKDSVLFAAHPVLNAVGEQVELKMPIELMGEGDLSPTALCLGRQPSPRCVFLVPIARESKVRNCEFNGIAYCFIERNEIFCVVSARGRMLFAMSELCGYPKRSSDLLYWNFSGSGDVSASQGVSVSSGK